MSTDEGSSIGTGPTVDMADSETLSERVDAVERAVTEDEQTLPEASTVAELAPRVDDIEDRQANIEERVTELEAATQALRGYVGSVKSVNEDVEQRADAALAAVDRLEDRIESTQTPSENTDSRGAEQSPGHQRSQRADSGRPEQSARSGQSNQPDRSHNTTEGLFGGQTGAGGNHGETVSEHPRGDAAEIRPPRTVGDDHRAPGSATDAEDDGTRAGVLARIRALL